jgi:metal-responsive CopG/Arc/MetJ family transcriptional regulator
MRAKVTISLPEELLAKLDAEAATLGVSRSELVQEAAGTYLGQTQEERVEEARRARVRGAIERMQEMADRNPMLDGRPTLEILREVRATDDSAPPYRREGSE